MGRISMEPERCKGCGYCIEVCPSDLIVINNTYNKKGYPVALFKAGSEDECKACKLCAEVCPDVAIEVFR